MCDLQNSDDLQLQLSKQNKYFLTGDQCMLKPEIKHNH